MILKIIIFFILFFIISKLLKVGFAIYQMKKHIEKEHMRNQTQKADPKDIIDAEFRVISEEE